jgi:hypothetical protein
MVGVNLRTGLGAQNEFFAQAAEVSDRRISFAIVELSVAE